MIRNISQPWNGLDGTNGVHYSSIARNYLRYGVWNLRLGQALNPEEVENLNDLNFYQHHPPLLPLLLAAGFYVIGENEATARLIPILSSFGSILLVFALSARVYDRRFAVIVTCLFASLPGILFFGRMPGFEAPTLFFILLAVWFYLRFLDDSKRSSLLGLYLALAAGLLTDWPAYLLVPLISLHCWLFFKDTSWRKSIVLGLPIFAAAIFTVFQAQSFLVDPDSFNDLLNQGLVYMGLLSRDSPVAARYRETQVTFTALQYTIRVLSRLDLLFSYPILILSLIGLWHIRKEKRPYETLIFVLLGVGFSYCVIFYRSVFIHYWHTYYLSAPIAILAALGARSVFAGDGEERTSKLVPKQTAIFLLAAVVVAGMIPRLWSLHQIQTKLLPGDQLERATFLKEVGSRVRSFSRANSLILANIPPPARRQVGYYSARKIIWGVDSTQLLTEQLKGVLPGTHVHFLFWSPENSFHNPGELYAELKQRGSVTPFSVDGYRFAWINLDTQTVDPKG
jgi:4-amino-4-deoxy-L-arabinose transferase-like glycosyltransferase